MCTPFLRINAEEFRELDKERILVLLRDSRLSDPGWPVTAPPREGTAVFHLGDGKVTRLVFYGDATAPSPTSGCEGG